MAEDKQVRLLPFIRKEILFAAAIVFGVWTVLYDTDFRQGFMDAITLSQPRSMQPKAQANTQSGAAALGKSTSLGPTSGIDEQTKAKPERDWIDLTDKFIDWFVKLVGCACAAFGAYGIYKTNRDKQSGESKA